MSKQEDWIPCSERLPEKDGYYQVTIDLNCDIEKFIAVSQFQKGEWEAIGVIAWMPLPEPYKGDV